MWLCQAPVTRTGYVGEVGQVRTLVEPRYYAVRAARRTVGMVKAYQTFIHNTRNKAKMGLVTLDDIFETVSGRAVDFHSRPPLHALT